ncbi:snapalysin [Streptomyces sp. CBMA152]|uniref:snapalysin n=1 Tax=Streptomyces sp. CBMA152 TaxID=1896312 RepID=UPI001660F00B|nr:snapalysin [Streptomyces sp. CBMA152]MBD0745980.1 ABC transporter substrate-binding protein [Streptomyces sp. CBMA152]
MRHQRTLVLSLSTALGLALAGLGAIPANAATAPSSSSSPAYVSHGSAYAGSAKEAANNKAFYNAVMKSVAKKRAAHPLAASVTVSYSTDNAPSFRSEIAQAAQIWNSSVQNVRLQESSGGADFSYYEGSDPQGSYASTDGHGNGYIFLDYQQNQEYYSVRVVAHETGHVLGLPDHYSGPCSELMSGGGPGPSCTNPYPDGNERAQVNQLWQYGLASAFKPVA